MHAAILLAVLGSLACPATAQSVRVVPYAELVPRLVTRVDFEDAPRRFSPGHAIEGLYPVEGAAIGERFAGQALSQVDGFDRLTAAADPPLRLEAGAPGRNLAVIFIYPITNLLSGLAPPGWPADAAGGEGAIAILFDRDQFALGFRVAAEPGGGDPVAGRLQAAFFRRDGTLIAELSLPLVPGRAAYGFLRDGERADIAGVAITNSDPEGIAIDDVIFDVDARLSLLR